MLCCVLCVCVCVDKLHDNLMTLVQTAAFVRATGLSSWGMKYSYSENVVFTGWGVGGGGC